MANSVAKTTENVFSTIKWTKYGKRMHRSVQRGASKNCLPANGIRRNYFSIRCCLAHNKWEMTYRSYCNGCTPSDYMFCSTWNEIMCHNSIPHVLVAHSIITIFIHYKSPGDTKFEIWYYVFFCLLVSYSVLARSPIRQLACPLLLFRTYYDTTIFCCCSVSISLFLPPVVRFHLRAQ